MDIDISNVSKSYDDFGKQRVIFKDLSVWFPHGKTSMIMGKSGTGKSSLLNMIAGIDLPDSGQIELDHQDLSKMDDTRRTCFRRKHIGFIYQFFNLIPVLTVLENVTLISKLDNVPETTYLEKAQLLLEQVGLEDRCDHFPDRLSGGEQQRVAIVRALVNDPLVLLADEPTGNLDDETGKTVLELLSKLSRKNNKTLIMVTHSQDALEYADQAYSIVDYGMAPFSAKQRVV